MHYSLLKFFLYLGLISLFGVAAIIPDNALFNPEISAIINDLLHFPALWVIQVFLLMVLSKITDWSAGYKLLVATTISFSAAFGLEWVQPYFDRTREIMDIVVGALAVFAVAIIYSKQNQLISKSSAHIAVTSVFVIFSLLGAFKFYLLDLKTSNFPYIGKFESPLALFNWSNLSDIEEPKLTRLVDPRRPDNYIAQGERLDYPWTGVVFKNQLSYDISQYLAFSIRLFNPGKSTIIALRLDDSEGNRYYPQELVADKGWNNLMYKLEPESAAAQGFDFKHLVKIAAFYKSEDGPDFYRVDDLKFIKDKQVVEASQSRASTDNKISLAF